MDERARQTAVGAGTTAGDAAEEVREPESRAAEAELDEDLESLRVDSARLTGGAAPTGASPEADQAAKARRARSAEIPPVAPSRPTPARPERPREELSRNEAGIASRLD